MVQVVVTHQLYRFLYCVVKATIQKIIMSALNNLNKGLFAHEQISESVALFGNQTRKSRSFILRTR